MLRRIFIRLKTGNRSMRPGEIFLAQFPFGDVAGMKLRPVLMLTGAIGPIPEALVAYISSVVPVQLLASDILLDPATPEFRSTQLKTTSVLRLRACLPQFIARLLRGGWGPLGRGSRLRSPRNCRFY